MLQDLTARTYDYRLGWGKPSEHTYLVELQTQIQTKNYTDFRTNAWRPGRYILQNYAAAVSHFEAFAVNKKGEKIKTLSWRKIDKDVWRVQHSEGSVPEMENILVTYHFYANVYDAGASYVGEDIAYFNPVGVFMNVNQEYNAAVKLTVKDLPSKWKVATSLMKTNDRSVFTAETYHEFVDSPTIFSPNIKQFEFTVDKLKVYVHFQGNYKAPEGAERVYIENVSKIIREQIAIFGEIPVDEYHFIYGLVSFPMRHAVEHLKSAMFILPESVAESDKSFGGLYSITSHEFFHVWNIKTIRPASLYPYDYSKEYATGLHWFTEGITDYYADLVMARSGVYTHEQFYKDLSATIQSLENSYASTVISPEVSSWDSWLATSEFNHPLHRTSYYPLGTRVGLLMDFELIHRTSGKFRFDEVFKYLYQNYYKQNKGVPEDGIQLALEKISGDSWESFFDQYVRGTGKINYNAYFKYVDLNVKITEDPKPMNLAAKLGISRLEKIDGKNTELVGYSVKIVRPNTAAYDEGIKDGDFIVGWDGESAVDLSPLDKLKPRDMIKLTILRNGKEEKIKIKSRAEDFPVKVEINESGGTDKTLRNFWLKSAVN